MASRYAFAKNIKELRFILCQTSNESASARAFLSRTYPVMKKHNPNVPILIREALGTEPRVFARYEFGREEQRSLFGLAEKEIEEKITTLVQ